MSALPPSPEDQVAKMDRAMRNIRDALAPLLKLGSEAAGPVGAILEALSEIEAVMLQQGTGPSRDVRESRRARRGSAPRRYFIETIGDQKFLVEERENSRAPFRIPLEVFEAVVRVLSSVDEPLPFYELHEQVGEIIGGELSEYQIRVSLRFLTSPEIGLVQRQRARYVATNRRRLQANANTHIRSLDHR